jgi:hypothetical protein
MTKSLRTAALLAVFGFAIAACGGSDSSDGDATDVVESVETTEAPAEEEAAPVSEAPPATEAAPATEAPPATEAAQVTEPAEESAVIVASLVEWAIEAPTEYVAGDVTFSATNNGNFPHEFAVIQAESYEALPLSEGGAVIEDDLPTGALIGRTARLGGGSVENLTVTLSPGNYVLVCNLGGGNNSHAGQGQRLDIAVS